MRCNHVLCMHCLRHIEMPRTNTRFPADTLKYECSLCVRERRWLQTVVFKKPTDPGTER